MGKILRFCFKKILLLRSNYKFVLTLQKNKNMNSEKNKILSYCNSLCKNTLMEWFEIEFVDVTDTTLVAKMPITPKVTQPNGILHGGASAALGESVGSMAGIVFTLGQEQEIRGIDITLNHVRAAQQGYVYATATRIHSGRTLQHWDIKITDQDNKLISYGKHTTIAIPKNKK